MRAFWLGVWMVAACGVLASQCSAQGNVDLGAEFPLRVGGVAQVRNTDVTVRLERVDNDSRCPSGAQCIVAGDADVVVSLTRDATRREHTLHVSAEPRGADDGAYRIELVSLAPTPSVDQPVRQSDYVARLRLTRAPGR